MYYTGIDPIAQTFYIKAGMALGGSCVYVSKIDLYFKRKSNTNGVTVFLKEVINGYPSNKTIAFSKVHLTSSQVNISDDASVATEFVFEAPIRLNIETEYCFVIEPDGGDPNYLVFTSRLGETDLLTGNAISQDWGDGVLFTATNSRAWKSYQDEDIKFDLYRRNFNVNEGTVVYVNDDHEFLTISNVVKTFIDDEIVYSEKSSNVRVTVSQNSNIVTGTNLTSTFAIGDKFVVKGSNNNIDILTVNLINDTQIIAVESASFSGTFNAVRVVSGKVAYFDRLNPTKIYLEKSNAGNIDKFIANTIIKGILTGAEARIESIDDIEISYIQPEIYKVNTPNTSTRFSGIFIGTDDVEYTKAIPTNDKTQFTTRRTKIESKSNSLTDGKLKIQAGLFNSGINTVTPIIDTEITSVVVHQYQVTDDESTTSSYVAKTVELQDQIDAETFRLYLTAHRPPNTNIVAYVKVQSQNDSSNFDDCPWIKLKYISGENLFCSAANLNDFREFILEPEDSSESNSGGINNNGIIEYTNINDIVFEGYKRFCIKLVMTSTNGIGSVPFVADYRAIALT